MLDYTAIDFETANGYRGSPCAVGLVRVRNGVPVAQARWLMRPPELVDHFDPFNVWVHGITAADAADAPRWKNLLPSIIDFIGDDVAVAHNAAFDIGVVRYACAVDNIEWPAMRFLCTLVLARRALSLPSYRLPFVVEAVGRRLTDHHDALADAYAVVDVVAGLAAAQGVNDVEALAAAHHVGIGWMSRGIYTGSVAISPGSASRLVQPDLNPDADPDGYLYGRIVVFTGRLMSMTRQIAWEECARVGARTDQGVTKQTNVLVIGDINPAVLRPGCNLTDKARKAFRLQDKGQDIEVMTEDDFLRCLDGKPLDAVAVLLADAAPTLSAAPPKREPQRAAPIAERIAPKPRKPPPPLNRAPSPTDQTCSEEGCNNIAAFRTRTKPTWCIEHIAAIQRMGGLVPVEPFTHPESWQLTECLTCSVQAHYRFVYTLDKNSYGEPTCRACFWQRWAAESRARWAEWAEPDPPVPYEEARTVAEDNGFEYLGPLTAPSLRDDPHLTRCRRCGKISAERLSDIRFGCTCSRS